MAKIIIDSKDDIMDLNVDEEFAILVKEFIWDNHKKIKDKKIHKLIPDSHQKSTRGNKND